MRAHLAPCVSQFQRIGFDLRTKEQRERDAQAEERYRRQAVLDLAREYNRENLFEEVWSEPMRDLAKKYHLSDVALLRSVKN
jgi:hypothetical protein